MTGRPVYFSFHYEGDIWRASIIRNMGVVDATARIGWDDASLWEKAMKKGDPESQRLIDKGLDGTSVDGNPDRNPDRCGRHAVVLIRRNSTSLATDPAP